MNIINRKLIQTFVRNMVLAGVLNLMTMNVLAAGLLVPTGGNSILQIQSHQVNVTIEEGFAITEVTQVFGNPSASDLEAKYSFPVPKDASVGEFSYWVDDQPIHGEVLEKARAKEVYEEERSAGREAALVEKNAYKTFEIMVTPVRAHDSVKIRLVYLQPTYMDLGVGRYVYPLEEGGVDSETQAFWSSNNQVEQQFNFNIRVRSAYPVETLRFAKNSGAKVSKNNQGEWEGSISNSANISEGENVPGYVASLDKDIVVYWKHPSNMPASIDLVSYREQDKEKGSFVLSIPPGEDLKPIDRGKSWVFVLDISGSMAGKLSTLTEGVALAIDKMDADSKVKVIAFDNSAYDITSGYVNLTPGNKARVISQVRALKEKGGTNLYAGLKKAIDGLDEERTTSVILVTDGVANVGKTHKKAFYQLLDTADVRLFTFIMGNSANEPLLSSMAKYSNGFAQSVSNSDDIIGQITWAMEKVKFEAFHDIEVEINGVRISDVTPKDLGSFYKGQQINLFGHYWGSGKARVTVSGKVSGETVSWQQQVDFPDVAIAHPELERLWAFAKIQSLKEKMDKLGESKDAKQSILHLALEYGLVTNYTSMLVVREEVFQALNISRNNKARIEKEQDARSSRAATPTKQAAQSTNQAIKPRATFSGGGGGSLDFATTLLLLSILYSRRRKFIPSLPNSAESGNSRS